MIQVMALALFGCGYRLAGSVSNPVLERVKVVVVVPFENRTTRPEIEQRVDRKSVV